MLGAHAAARILDKQIEESKMEDITLDHALELFKDKELVKRLVALQLQYLPSQILGSHSMMDYC